jgi:putative acetyltransferase
MPASPPAPIAIRPCADADGLAVSNLIAGVFAEYEDCPFVPDEFPELAAPASAFAARGGHMWVAQVAGPPPHLVGCIAIAPSHEPGTRELFKVYVHSGLRGAGLARRLLELAIAQARREGATRLVAWSDTRFTRGHTFYRKHGFRQRPGLRALHDAGCSLEAGFERDLAARPV